jgi:hypothetical protein
VELVEPPRQSLGDCLKRDTSIDWYHAEFFGENEASFLESIRDYLAEDLRYRATMCGHSHREIEPNTPLKVHRQ